MQCYEMIETKYVSAFFSLANKISWPINCFGYDTKKIRAVQVKFLVILFMNQVYFFMPLTT